MGTQLHDQPHYKLKSLSSITQLKWNECSQLYRSSQIILSAYKLTLTAQGLSTEDAILIFEAGGFENSWLPWRLKCQMVEMKIHSIIINLLSVLYIHSSQDILILMFCTSLARCKVNVGCICWTEVRRTLP